MIPVSKVVTVSATVTGLHIKPVMDPKNNKTVIGLHVIATDANSREVPHSLLGTRRRPTSAELAAINAVVPLPGEPVIPTWIERAAMPYVQAVFTDLLPPSVVQFPAKTKRRG
jgi:hypothetical protein